MVGIVSYGTHIPYYRLTKAAAASAFGKRAGAGEKAVAYCDEDSVTMAVEASLQAVAGKDLGALKTVFFASASSPYAEKISATELAAALDLELSVRTAVSRDLTHWATGWSASGRDAGPGRKRWR